MSDLFVFRQQVLPLKEIKDQLRSCEGTKTDNSVKTVHYNCRVKYFKISTISKHLKLRPKKKSFFEVRKAWDIPSWSIPTENWTTKSMHLYEVADIAFRLSISL